VSRHAFARTRNTFFPSCDFTWVRLARIICCPKPEVQTRNRLPTLSRKGLQISVYRYAYIQAFPGGSDSIHDVGVETCAHTSSRRGHSHSRTRLAKSSYAGVCFAGVCFAGSLSVVAPSDVRLELRRFWLERRVALSRRCLGPAAGMAREAREVGRRATPGRARAPRPRGLVGGAAGGSPRHLQRASFRQRATPSPEPRGDPPRRRSKNQRLQTAVLLDGTAEAITQTMPMRHQKMNPSERHGARWSGICPTRAGSIGNVCSGVEAH